MINIYQNFNQLNALILDITEETFKSLSKLSKLQKITLLFQYSLKRREINELIIKQLVDKCVKLKRISYNDCRMYRTSIDLNEREISEMREKAITELNIKH